MRNREHTRREALRYGVFAGAAVGLAACTGGGAARGSGGSAGRNGALPDIEGGRVITDPARFPATFAESPEFAERAAAGELPPVAERVGQDPLVIEPVHGIGKYGGTIRRGYIGTTDQNNANHFCAGPDSLLYWDYTWQTIVPNIARDFELSGDFMVTTLHLRRGMKWSDGEPFTADDILFWRDDISLNDELSGGSSVLQDVTVEKVDDYTVRYTSKAPNPLLPEFMASRTDVGGQSLFGGSGGGGFAPKHYLSRFHPAYTSKAEADRLAAEAGFDGWAPYVLHLNTWYANPDLPTLTPWVVTRSMNDPPFEFTANPYSIWVDTDGNQLPYIPKITMRLSEDPEVIILRAVAGEVDFQDRHLAVASLPVLLKNQERSNYTIHRAPSEQMDFGVRINLAYDVDKQLGELIRTTDFRRALSLGIDRDQINEAFFLGTSTPSATMCSDDNPYFPGPEWRTKWATHEPERANALLDEIGLTKRDGNGFRQRPDGKGRIVLDYQTVHSFADFPAMGEMIKQQWAELGIDLNVQEIEGSLAIERSQTGELMLTGHQTGTDEPFLYPPAFLPVTTTPYLGLIGIPYAEWFRSGGTDGTEPPKSLRLLKDAFELYERGFEAPEKERIQIGKKLYMMHADQVWSIGVVGFGLMLYGIYYAKNNMRNVPARMMNTLHQKTPSNALPMTFYYE